ncbi:MAG: beta-ketoacyl-[acyl-carrier-protein] synthase family protein [Acetobacteraceae bacterium]
MEPLILSACSLVSAIGIGTEPTLAALRNRRSGLMPSDFAGVLSGYIGRVAAVERHQIKGELAPFDCRNNRLADLALRTDGFDDLVAAARERYGPGRMAVIVGTSTSGVLSTEEAYRHRDPRSGALPDDFDFEHTHDFSSLPSFVRARLGLTGPAFAVSTACASSARVFIDAYHLIMAGVADAAVVGGADSLCSLTLRGFAALGLIDPSRCRPCDARRNGISIGEAAGFALVERGSSGVALLGYGASSDGYHLSAPRPDGAGAIRAMQRALASSGLAPDAIDYVNLHGTGTKANDAMEDLAVARVLGPRTPVSSTKGWTGHTLGAAGITEVVLSLLCIRHGLLPGSLNLERIDPAFTTHVLIENRQQRVRRVLSNSFGFGGINCSLVLGMLP